MYNVINFNNLSSLIDLINIVLLILNIKLADSVILLSNFIDIFRYYNISS